MGNNLGFDVEPQNKAVYSTGHSDNNGWPAGSDMNCVATNLARTQSFAQGQPFGQTDTTNSVVMERPSSSSLTRAEESQQQNLQGIDPSLEDVVDIRELLTTTIPNLEAEGPLNIDNIFSSGDLDLIEGHTSTANFLDISKYVPEPVQKICMTNTDTVTSTQNGDILTIKAEDLQEFPACQGYPQDITVCAADSLGSPRSTSSRSSTPKTPIVYECRKPGRKPSANGPIRPRKREPPKDTSEYFEKRARNNVAVRKSREKAKLRQNETESRVSQLTNENDRLQKKVDLLTKELNVLKSLFINVGAALPENFEELLSR